MRPYLRDQLNLFVRYPLPSIPFSYTINSRSKLEVPSHNTNISEFIWPPLRLGCCPCYHPLSAHSKLIIISVRGILSTSSSLVVIGIVYCGLGVLARRCFLKCIQNN